MATKSHLKVFYDGACGSCVEDRARYELWLGKHIDQVEWFDITGQESYLLSQGIDPQRALRELHVQDSDGVIDREINAYVLLLDRIWWLKPVGWLIRIPWIRARLSRWYRRRVDERLARDGRG